MKPSHIPILNVVVGPIPSTLVAATFTVITESELRLMHEDDNDVVTLIPPVHTPWSQDRVKLELHPGTSLAL